MFTKFSDNLTNNDDENILITNLKFDVKYIALSANMPSGLN